MKRTPFLGPILWRPTIISAVFLVQNVSLKAEKQMFTSHGVENFTLSTTVQQELESVDTSDFSWVENDQFYPSSRSEDSISFGLALQNLPLYLQLRRFQYRPTPFISNGKPRANLRVFTRPVFLLTALLRVPIWRVVISLLQVPH